MVKLLSGKLPEYKVFQLFGLAFLITVLNHVFDLITVLPIFLGYVLKYILVTCLVMLFGFIAGWFCRSNFFMAFIYVAIVFIVAYALDMVVTQKDVNYINARIKEREEENNE